MATYYKRVEREADSQVNWAEIGKSMSDMLANENKIREDKKAAIDKASRDYAEVLANSPQGEHVGARQQALDFANNASQYMLMQDKLLKSGQLKLKDYTIGRQNLVDDTDRAFKMNAEYQKVFAEKMERSRTDISALYELDAMERIEGFGNFSQSGMYIDPTTGRVSMAMKEKQIVDGKEVYVMADNPEKRTTIDTLNGLLLGKWDKYKVNDATTAFAESIGDNIQTLRTVGSRTKAGQILTVSDVLSQARQEVDINAEITSKEAQIKALEGKTDKKSIAAKAKLEGEIKSAKDELVSSKAVFDFVKFETDGINSMLANDFNRMSVLTDNKKTAPNGKIYRFTRNAEDAKNNEEAILMVPDPASGMEKPQFSEAQLKESTEFMRTNLRGKYDYKETSQTVSDYQAPQQQQQWQYEAGQDKKNAGDLLSQWQKLYSASNAADKNAAAQSLLGNKKLMEMGITDIDMSDGKNVNLIYSNGVRRTIPLYTTVDGAEVQVSPTQWAAQGVELHGVEDSNQYQKYKGDVFQNVSDWSGVKANRTVAQTEQQSTSPDNTEQIKSAFKSVPDDVFSGKSDDAVAQELQAALGSYGVTVRPTGSGGLNYISIELPDGVTRKEFPVNAWSDSGAEEHRTNIATWLKENLNKETASGSQGVGANYNE
jgi:hypothetical protein